MKQVVAGLGVVFLIVGFAGFAMPHMAGAHLSPVHNIIHIVSGALALYFGWRGSTAAACTFSLVFGAVYLLLGAAGFLLGQGAERMLTVLPGALQLGLVDHVIHVAFGLVFLVLGLSLRRSHAPAH